MANGKYGEQLFHQIMKSRDYKVVDVSNDSTYWDKDIDFIVTSPSSGLTKSFEVKYDDRIKDTGNLYLELTNVHSKGGRGWYEFCQADYLAYGDARRGIFYIISLADLRNRVKQEKLGRLAHCGTDSIGLLVALKDIEDITKIL